MKKPYLKELKKIGNITVWIVDGMYVRDKMNAEFTNFGQHYRFRIIPTNEFWLDKEYTSGEEDFFIHHLLVEWKLMRKGMSYTRAIGYADMSERAERNRSGLMKKLKSKKLTEENLKHLHKKKFATYKNGITVWIVRAEMVRDLCFLDFTEGGHDYVYSFVPKKEIWLDDDLSEKERLLVLLHELHERRLMATGMDYHHAHASSIHIELESRHKPSVLQKNLKAEIALNE